MDVSPSGGGTVQINQTAPSSYPATSSFKDGTSVNLEAVPAPGYIFENWSGRLSGTTNPTTIVMDCKKSVTANFSQKTTTQVSWPLVGGVIGALVLVGLPVAVLIVRRRAG